MKKHLLVLTATSALVLSACGQKEIPHSARINNAPTDSSRTGLLVSNVTEAELAQTLKKYPEMKVRLINKKYGLFEVHQVSESALKQSLGEKAYIRPNRYIRLIDHPAESFPNFKHLRSILRSTKNETTVARQFLDECVRDPLTEPTIHVTTDAQMDRFEFSRIVQRHSPVSYRAAESVAHDGSAVDLLWVVRPAQYSKLPTMAYMGDVITITPDTTGEFIIFTIARDQRGVCAMVTEPLFVTADPQYNHATAMTENELANFDLSPYWQLDAMNAIESWDYSTGRQITVAVIDTGVNYNHAALSGNIAVNKKEIAANGIDDDNNGFVDDVIGYDFGTNDAYPFDDYGHGTHCAGIAGSPAFGIAPDAKIMPIKVGAGPGMDIGSVVGGIIYAVDNGAQILNLSVGFEEDFPELRTAVEYARNKGVVVIAAAGNGDNATGLGIDNDQIPLYPANYDLDNVVAVAATNIRDELSVYSNFGLRTVHVAAPGGDRSAPIFSTYKENAQGRQTEYMSGTSMATPAVAGVVAQVLSLNPALTPFEIRGLLATTGKAAPSLAGKIHSQSIVNSLGALTSLAPQAPLVLAEPAATRP